jgi:hypothetical protein
LALHKKPNAVEEAILVLVLAMVTIVVTFELEDESGLSIEMVGNIAITDQPVETDDI